MITEDYVSFETAKLLKEKGFDLHTYAYYEDEDNPNISLHASRSIDWNKTEFISKPTLHMVIKWLNEMHNLFIGFVLTQDVQDVQEENPVIKNYYHFNVSRLDRFANEGGDCRFYNSYEEAVVAAIKYCLKNLI